MTSSPRQIVLTGVSRGLGLSLAEGFVAEGHVVHGCARSANAIAQLRERWASPHSFEALDVSNDAEVAAWAMRLRERDVVPDLVVNNAALVNRNARLWEISADEFDAVLAVNVSGVTNVIRHFVPAMGNRGSGVIVNFSSGWGRVVSAEVAPYCATKWAIEGLSKALAEELPQGMASIPLNPGIIDTEMLRSCFGADAESYPTPDAWARQAVPFILALGPKDNGASLTVPR